MTHRTLAALLVGIAFLVIAPQQATAQARKVAPSPAPILLSASPWSTTSLWSTSPALPLPAVRGLTEQSQPDRSARRIIVTRAIVGAGAGLLVGLVLSGANVSHDDASVVLTWTAAGLTAGALGGVIVWLVELRD
jgi:hypothetical protein